MSEWQPIETAPKNGERVLLNGPGGIFIGSWLVKVGWHQTTGWVRDRGDSPYLEESVKHWMPLPEPPK